MVRKREPLFAIQTKLSGSLSHGPVRYSKMGLTP
jgi:hypothetical protein